MMTAHTPVADSLSPSPRREALRRMSTFFLAWAFVYLVLQGQDGFFARTVDEIDVLWVQLLFLNLPLQLVLALAVGGAALSNRERVQSVGLWVAGLNTILIAGHVVLSIATS